LFPVLAFSYFFIYRASKHFVKEKISQILFSIAFFISIWLIFVIYSGLVSESFVSAMFFGSVLTFTTSLVLDFYLKKYTKLNFEITPPKQSKSRRWMWLSAILTSLMVYYIAVNGNFHDEGFVNGHKAIIAQLQNNYFPPRNLLLPSIDLRYHFGFDLLSAALTGITRCSVDHAIDFFSTASWFYCWIGLWVLGEKLFTSSYAGFCVAACTLFGGGLGPILGVLLTDFRWEVQLTGLFDMHTGIVVNPPIMSYFFQHPFAAGFPVVVSILLLVSEKQVENKVLNQLVLVFLFVALYFCQSILFLTLFPTLFLFLINYRKQFYSGITAVLILALLFISGSGLLFSSSHFVDSSILHFRFWPMHAPIIGIGGWYVCTFGLMLYFAVLGFFYLKQMKPVFAYIILVSAGIPFFVVYGNTWDIVKFATVAAFYMGILTGGAIGILLERKRYKVWVISGLVLCIYTGLLNAGIFIYKIQFGNKYYLKYDHVITDDHIKVINDLRELVKDNEMVFCEKKVARDFAVFGGLPVIYDEDPGIAKAFGLSEEYILKYFEMSEEKVFNESDFQKYNVTWIVNNNDDSLNLKNQIPQNRLRIVSEYNNLKLYQYIKEGSTAHTIKNNY
jgi:hypothetical protein